MPTIEQYPPQAFLEWVEPKSPSVCDPRQPSRPDGCPYLSLDEGRNAAYVPSIWHVGKGATERVIASIFNGPSPVIIDLLILDDDSTLLLEGTAKRVSLHIKRLVVGKRAKIDFSATTTGINGAQGGGGGQGERCHTGPPGGNGQPGGNGGDAPKVDILAYIQEIGSLTIKSRGGNGGNGGAGGQGGRGGEGRSNPLRYCRDAVGGYGGQGGRGGNGGSGGDIHIVWKNLNPKACWDNPNSAPWGVRFDTSGGAAGAGGPGGPGGEGRETGTVGGGGPAGVNGRIGNIRTERAHSDMDTGICDPAVPHAFDPIAKPLKVQPVEQDPKAAEPAK